MSSAPQPQYGILRDDSSRFREPLIWPWNHYPRFELFQLLSICESIRGWDLLGSLEALQICPGQVV